MEKREWPDTRWISNTEPILAVIRQTKGGTLTDDEIKRLNDIISSDAFRQVIENIVLERIRKKGINGLEAVLASLDLCLIMAEYIRDKDRRGKIIHDEELEKDKETFLKTHKRAVKSMKSMPPGMKKSAIPLGDMFYDLGDVEKMPDELIEKVKGVSKTGAGFIRGMEGAKVLLNIAEEVEEKYGVDKIKKE